MAMGGIMTIIFIMISLGIQGGFTCPDTTKCIELHGIMNGGRCFFTVNVATTWNAAWTECEKAGGTLAQIHTDSEYEAVQRFLTVSNGLWIAIQRDSSLVAGVPCSDTMNKNYWYDNATTPNPRMTAANTWMTKHACDSGDDNTGEFCLIIWMEDDQRTWVGDESCSNTDFRPLCEYNSQKQSYILKDACMGTSIAALETFDTNQPIECANACTARNWCRSYNLIATDPTKCTRLTCQLFSWTSIDNNASMSLTAGECIHYDYIP